jgi:hypothetical protein
MEQGEFRTLNRAMYMALKCFWDESLPELTDAQYFDMATNDWAMDCPPGQNHIDWPLFGLSLFQLAHTWTHLDHTANSEACLDFLSKLHEFLCTEENGKQRMATDDEIRAKTTAKKDRMKDMLAVARASLNSATMQWEMTDELAEVLISPAKEEAIALYGEGNISTVCGEAGAGSKRGQCRRKKSRRLSVNSSIAAKAQKSDLDRRKGSYMKLPIERTTEMVLKFMDLHLAQLKDEWSEMAEAVRQARKAAGARRGSRTHARRSSAAGSSCRSASGSGGRAVGSSPSLPALKSPSLTPQKKSKPLRRVSSKQDMSPPSERIHQTRASAKTDTHPEGGRQQGRRASGGIQGGMIAELHAQRSSGAVGRAVLVVGGSASLPALDAMAPTSTAKSARRHSFDSPSSSPKGPRSLHRSESLLVKHPVPPASAKDAPAVERQLF